MTDLDDAGQLALMKVFLTKLIVNPTTENEGKDDFTNFYHSTYQDDSKSLAELDEYFGNYKPENAIKYYTKPNGFISRIVSETCTSLDNDNLLKIRFYLRDLYQQLIKLHEEQLELCFQEDFVVYRGATISKEELARLETKENLFITRNFLSTSPDQEVAKIFAGNRGTNDDEVSVLICMYIEHSEIQEKPIAFIGHLTYVADEVEIMLPVGLVFRTVPVEGVNETGIHCRKITMIRGEDERKIEKDLNEIAHMIQMGTSCPLLGMDVFLTSTPHGQHFGEFVHSIPRVHNVSDIPATQQPLHTSNVNFASPQIPTNTGSSEINFVMDSLENIPDNPLSNITNQNGLSNTGVYSVSEAAVNGIGNENQIFGTIAGGVGFKTLLTVGIVSFVVVSIVVIATAVIVSTKPKTHSEVTTVCPDITCSIVTSILNPSANYQVEQLNLTCSQTFVNMTIIQTIQRTLNETYAQQYQTFWNDSTNMTYLQTPTQLTCFWISNPGMLIVRESFPHFINAQYYYTPGSTRNTSGDTWQIWFQSICGQMQYLDGTY